VLKPVYLTLIILFSAQSSAQIACSEIENDNERLACYDHQSKDTEALDSSLPEDWDKQQKPQAVGDYSLLNERWELDQDLVQYAFRAYKPVYFLPVAYSSDVNTTPRTDNPETSVTDSLNIDHLEARLQLSFKTKLINDVIGNNGDLWFGYTQSSHWQLYNSEESRPFRETNHEPEFMYVWRTHYSLFGFHARMLSLSLNHQSNGQGEPLSRSWNRFILTVGFDRPDWVVQIRPWWRIPERSTDEDENPDIEDYIGRGEVLIVHRKNNSHQIATQIRHSFGRLEDARGSIKVDWSYPCFHRLRCHAQIFHGYGESLIDFNHKTTSVGLGVALVEWF